ncbi:DUF6174 domain-containing protein [Leptothrix ochracea]|uniref:DUF6174 domain-containing protein n=1 Tax=Leptothrix ochracea TaxID=735331 RepID=UPI0034E232B7
MKPIHGWASSTLLFLLTSCGGSAAPAVPPTTWPAVTDRASAGARWAALGIRSYRFTLHTTCFCLPEEDIVITVQSGSMVSAIYALSGQAVPASRVSTLVATSVEGLLALIDSAAARPAAVLNVTYHPSLGYPQSMYIDWVQNMADDEFGYTVVNLTML